jgi:RNA polymerase sigma-70 factor (ECF subfamily)
MCSPETIAALQKGDELAFTALFAEYHKKIYGYVLAKTHSHYLAEEVTQMTFIKLWDYRRNLRIDLSVSQQVFRIVKTTLIDALRAQSTRNNKLRAVKNESVADSVLPVSIENKEQLERTYLYIKSMPPVRQKVFQLSRFEGLTIREIATALAISVKAVEKHITQALRQIKHMLWVISFLLVTLF